MKKRFCMRFITLGQSIPKTSDNLMNRGKGITKSGRLLKAHSMLDVPLPPLRKFLHRQVNKRLKLLIASGPSTESFVGSVAFRSMATFRWSTSYLGTKADQTRWKI